MTTDTQTRMTRRVDLPKEGCSEHRYPRGRCRRLADVELCSVEKQKPTILWGSDRVLMADEVVRCRGALFRFRVF